MKKIVFVVLLVIFGLLFSYVPLKTDLLDLGVFKAAVPDPSIAAKKAADAATLIEATKNFYTGPLRDSGPNQYTLTNLTTKVLPAAAGWIASFLGAIAVLFLIWAGIQFLTAEGEPDKIAQATKTAFYVIAGVLLLMFASALVYLFLTIFAPPLPPSSPSPQPTTTAPAPTPAPDPDQLPLPELQPGQEYS